MGDVKLHYGNRLRLDVRYPGKPDRGQPEPLAGAPVHYMDAALFVSCRVRGAGVRLKTRLAEKVTCPACRKILNLPAHPKQPPQGSPAGATTLSAESALLMREETDHHHASSSFGGSPASASAGAGFFIRILRERPRPLGRGCRAHRAKRGQSGARCCSIYWRNTSIGAPPHEAAK